MFEDFSFLSPATTITPDPGYFDCVYVDPLQPLSPSSSCSSTPISPQFPTSRLVRDPRYQRTPSMDSLTPPSRRHSIDTLTSQFDSHSPFDSSSTTPPADSYQPRSTPVEEDEGFDEPASNHAGLYTTTSYEAPLTSLDYSLSTVPSRYNNVPRTAFSARRRQRQLLSRLQCLSSGDSNALAMLIEECHPSSLPLTSSESVSDSENANGQQSVTSAGLTRASTASSVIPRRTAIVKREPRFRRRKS